MSRGAASAEPDVAGLVRAAIDRSGGPPHFRDLLITLLARSGRVLAPEGHAKWPAFVIETAEALDGAGPAATTAAAAVEFAVAAIDVVDDLVDDEWEGPAEERNRALNAGLALSWLSQLCALDLARWLPADRVTTIAHRLSAGSLACCAGQDQDLRLELAGTVTEEDALEMTGRKSGSLVAMAFEVGAAVATSDARVIDLCGRLGSRVGIIAQLLNDLDDLGPAGSALGSDLRRRKKTLPIAYALTCARQEGIAPLLEWFENPTSTTADEATIAALCRDLGALHYTWVVADAHRAEALTILDEISATTGRTEIHDLRRLVPNLKTRRPRPIPA